MEPMCLVLAKDINSKQSESQTWQAYLYRLLLPSPLTDPFQSIQASTREKPLTVNPLNVTELDHSIAEQMGKHTVYTSWIHKQ